MAGSTRALGAIVVAALALGLRLFFAWAIPFASGSEDPNCAPDEAGHFMVVRQIARGRLATWPDAGASIYAACPPSQYAVQAATFALTHLGIDRHSLYRFPAEMAPAEGYLFARLGSVLLGVATVLALALAALAWTGSEHVGLVAGVVSAAYPQLVFIDAYTNGDAFTIAAGSVLVLAIARWARAGESDAGLAFVGVATGLVMLGKVSGYYVMPATVAWVVWSVLERRATRAGALRAASLAAVVCAPVLAYNGIRNAGDVLGLHAYRLFLSHHYRPLTPDSVAQPIATFLRVVAASAFGTFRNMDLALPSPLLFAAAAFLVAGLVVAATDLRNHDGVARRGALWLLATVALALVLAAYNAWWVDFQPQGRYVLLAAVLLTLTAAIAPLYSAATRRFAVPWLVAYVGFILWAVVQSAMLVYRNPCVPGAG